MKAAIVLGAAVWPDGPSPTLRRRTEAGVAALRHGADVLILTGGLGRHPPAEAEAARTLALALGAPEGRLRTETASTDTLGNLAGAIPLLPEGTARTLIVTNRWHVPRALAIARLIGLPGPAAWPVAGDLPPPALARAAARELAALPHSAWRAFRWARRSGR
ncbi:YdcF family protein [Jannaschia sp. Os4]|uniref:ElyC/SanA/YdcF family protein n=1 Tax=Jannaschia sp. Os4 TaxID=2807617 RepID=UPI001939AD8C|nr:YdcF family protein [Jannaschia sp. Os4]